MRMWYVGILMLFSTEPVFITVSQHKSVTEKIYLLEDSRATPQQWCGFSNKSNRDSQVNVLGSTSSASVEYKNNRASIVDVTTADDPGSGDWVVYDHYVLSEDENIQTLKRT